MKRHNFIWLCLVLVLFLTGTLSTSVGETILPATGNYVTAEVESSYVWPCPSSRHLTSGFGNRKIAIYGQERMHTGIDILAATGSEVLAIQSGTVLVSTYDGGWGNYVIINHGNNILSLYAHLNSRAVERGDSVTRGQIIGEVGNTGISSAPHLHFEMRENGKSFNPFRFTFSDQ